MGLDKGVAVGMESREQTRETQEDSGTDYLERRWVGGGREGSSEGNGQGCC